MIDAETLYLRLRDAAEEAGGTIGDHADDLLANAARAIADDSESALSITGDSDERWSMYSPKGNAVVAEHVRVLLDEIRAQSFPRRDLRAKVEAVYKAVEAAGHGEVYDTEPRCMVSNAVDEVCREVGWLPLDEYAF